MRPKAGPAIGRVLQGYFRIEQFRGHRAAVAQPLSSGRRVPAPATPRPDLLPAKLRGMVGQPKAAPACSGAPRPELLPGMGPAIAGGLRMVRMVAQARANDAVSTTPIPAGQLRVIGEGRPLAPEIRRTMERFFQADFSGVRVHVGPAAPAMGALAFTLGEEIHFAPGLYDPAIREGAALLGHELTHVVQQREGRAANPYGHGVAIVQDPALEAEADRMGQRVAEEIWSASSSFQHIPADGGQRRSVGHRAMQDDLLRRSARAPVVPTLASRTILRSPSSIGAWPAGAGCGVAAVAQPSAKAAAKKKLKKAKEQAEAKAKAAHTDEIKGPIKGTGQKPPKKAAAVAGAVSATISTWRAQSEDWGREGNPVYATEQMHAEKGAYTQLLPKSAKNADRGWVRITQNAFPCTKCTEFFDLMSKLHEEGGIVIAIAAGRKDFDPYSLNWPKPAAAAGAAGAADADAVAEYYSAPCEIYFVNGVHRVHEPD